MAGTELGRRVRRGSVGTLAYLALAVWALLSLYPFVWMLSGAFKDAREVTSNASPIPRDPTLDTLRNTWSGLDFGTYLLNSVKITGISLLLILLVFPLAAYAFAVLRFPLRRVLFGLFVATVFVPSVTVLLPIVLLDDKLGIIGSQWGVILPMVNGAGPLAILIARAHFSSVPAELREAARLDGASEIRIFWQVYLPLARPALVTIAVLNFVGIWNEYVLPSITLNDPGQAPLPVGLQTLLSSTVVNWNEVMAGALLVVLPVIAVFVALQRFFVNGLVGSVKG